MTRHFMAYFGSYVLLIWGMGVAEIVFTKILGKERQWHIQARKKSQKETCLKQGNPKRQGVEVRDA